MQNLTFLCYNVVEDEFLTQKTQKFHEKKHNNKNQKYTTEKQRDRNSGTE